MYPTRRAILLFAAGIPPSLLLIAANENLWPVPVLWLILAFFLLGIDLILAARPDQLALSLHEPPLLYIGDSDPLTLEIAAELDRPLDLDVSMEADPLLERLPDVTLTAAPDSIVRHDYLLTPLGRGTAMIRSMTLRWQGPMRLMYRQSLHPLDLKIAVTPNTRAVKQAAIEFFARDARLGLKTQIERGAGSEFHSVRDYVAGMEHRFIDWKRSARHRRLQAREFRTERNHQIFLTMDTGLLMAEKLGRISRLDHAINAALIMAYVSLRCGDRIGVVGFDSRVRLFAAPVGGTRSFPRLQQVMAELHSRPEETNFTLGLTELSGRLNRRSLIILMSEFVDTTTTELMLDNVSRLVRRHLVLFVTFRDPVLTGIWQAEPQRDDDVARAVIADDFIRERELVFERLKRMGVLVLDAAPGTLSTGLVNRYLSIQRRELI
jgi:uncharacterized protein (DUF58 family)